MPEPRFYPLQFAQAILEEEGYTTETLTQEEGAAVDMLLVALKISEEERYVLELLYVDDVIQAMGFESDLESSTLLQFLIRFPFAFVAERTPELALLLNQLSRILPAGNFGVSPKEGVIFFRYGLHLPAKNIEHRVLYTIVAGTEVALAMFCPLIKRVAEGAESAQSVLDELEQNGFEIPGIAQL